jgi:hypothetical protein
VTSMSLPPVKLWRQPLLVNTDTTPSMTWYPAGTSKRRPVRRPVSAVPEADSRAGLDRGANA